MGMGGGIGRVAGGGMAEHVALLALAALGLLHLLKLALLLLRGVWVAFLRPAKRLSRYGAWAVVTGATDGIGRALAYQLAKNHINVVLVGRSQPKLQDLVTELQSVYKVDARYAEVDFLHPDLDSGLDRIAKALEGLEVGILINNVGMSYPYARFFHEVDAELTRNLIRVNVEVTTFMVQLVLPGMLKRKRGAIINLGSGAASVVPSDPLYTVYAATKAFVDQFSRSLYVEYKHSGIDVQCQVPLYVATKMAKIRHSSFMVPSANAYAKFALNSIGYGPRCTPYWVHSVCWWLISVIPEPIVDKLRLRMNLDIRRRGLLKDARKKE